MIVNVTDYNTPRFWCEYNKILKFQIEKITKIVRYTNKVLFFGEWFK